MCAFVSLVADTTVFMFTVPWLYCCDCGMTGTISGCRCWKLPGRKWRKRAPAPWWRGGRAATWSCNSTAQMPPQVKCSQLWRCHNEILTVINAQLGAGLSHSSGTQNPASVKQNPLNPLIPLSGSRFMKPGCHYMIKLISHALLRYPEPHPHIMHAVYWVAYN